jgi:transcriptional regulator with XRE-family HTH domain
MASEPSIGERFGQNAARIRRRKGIPQEEVSVRASLHRTEISGLERGLRVPRIDTLVKLASALEVSPLDLLEGIEWSPGETVYGSFDVRQQDSELPPELPRGRKPADQDQRIG